MERIRDWFVAALVLAIALGIGACGADLDLTNATTSTTDTGSSEAMVEDGGVATMPASDSAPEPAGGDGLFPDVVGAVGIREDGGTWRFDVTISSPYDSPQRYADAWRIVGPDGAVYGERILSHDHANEQPFTRSQSGVAVPAGVTVVTIQGRDQLNGWGGTTLDLPLQQ